MPVDLAGDVAGEFLDQDQPLRQLVPGQLVAGVVDQALEGGVFAGFRDGDGESDLLPGGVGDADDRDVGDSGGV